LPTYVTLARLNPEGVRALKDWRSNYDEMKRIAETIGVNITAAYSLLGPYDMMFIIEADDEKDLMRQSLLFSTKGATVETWTAVPAEEFTEVTDSVRAFL
jgi:uncharacterized protein with GYD domain